MDLRIEEQLVKPIFEAAFKPDSMVAVANHDLLLSYQRLLSKGPFELKKIKELSLLGVPEEAPGLRALAWKVLLGYMPPNVCSWRPLLKKHRDSYEVFCKDFLAKEQFSRLNDFNQMVQKMEKEGKSPKLQETEDHPLSQKSSSGWNSYFRDQELWEDIEKDTKRTRIDLAFFGKEAPDQKTEKYVSFSKSPRGPIETNRDVLTRILFVYGKVNPEIRYVQGMNELLALLYFVFSQDVIKENRDHAEHDSFYCFSILMREVKDGFVKSGDSSSETGIKKRMRHLNMMLKKIDKVLWDHLESLEIDPHFYSLRWLVLFLTQEFELVDVLKIWDCLLCYSEKVEFLYYVCLSILLFLRKDLLKSGYSECVQRLQSIRELPAKRIVSEAVELFTNNRVSSTFSIT